MESDDIYKYVGFFIVVVFLIYMVIKIMKVQFRVLEGMTSSDSSTGGTDKDKVPEAIKSNTTRVEDALLIDKYTKAYEDTIIDLDANIDMYILNQLLTNAEKISADPGSDENQLLMTKINNAKNFKEALNHGIKVLDKK
uniref:Uncharacterized protein n=1 Tax=viral metagenome TaxID=1070528 RepID=A0A6C0IL49_9ZZZZ